MEQRTKDKLRNIRIKNDRNEYSQETFDIIYNILLEREENASTQTEQAETIKEENYNMTLKGFFSFQFLISPKLVRRYYIFGAFAVTIVSWILFMRNQLLMGTLIFIVGNLFWRLGCEIAVILFRMNERLGIIHQDLKRNISA